MGFFHSTPTPKEKRRSGVDHNLSFLVKQGCKFCPLSKTILNNPKMPPSGSLKNPLIYILGGSPGESEDSKGYHFAGKAGKILRSELESVFDNDFVLNFVCWDNVVRCRPTKEVKSEVKDRVPDQVEIECCRINVEDSISTSKPFIVVGFGPAPLHWVLKEPASISVYRGRIFPVCIKGHDCWYFSLFHPSYVLRSEEQKKFDSNFNKISHIFNKDIQLVKKFIESNDFSPPKPKVETKGYKRGIYCILGSGKGDLELVKSQLDKFCSYPLIGLDIENSPLKPYHPESTLASIAISNGEETVSFPILHPEASKSYRGGILPILKNFLLKSQIKCCHNLSHELEWFNWYFGKEVLFETKWADTMAQGYVLDERKGFLKLDQLCKLYFGFSLKSLSKVDIKNVLKEPLGNLLPYNALDAKYTFKLYLEQQKLLPDDLVPVVQHHIETSRTIALTQFVGLEVDKKEIENFSVSFSEKIKSARSEIQRLPEVLEFNKIRSKPFDPNSSHSIGALFESMKVGGFKKTKTGKNSTDYEVLEKLKSDGVEVAELILKIREFAKLKSTYIDGVLAKVSIGGRLRASFNSMFTSTGRLSSDSPNMQNFPKRKHKEVRRIIKAGDGFWFVSFDYAQLEGRVIAMVSKDEKFCQSIREGYDIHLAWAKRIIEIDPSSGGYGSYDEVESWKKLRDKTKNKWVFPLFYGSLMGSVGYSMNISNDSKLKKLYDEFWDTFKGVSEWQETLSQFYDKHGYVSGKTGRRRRGPLDHTQIINSPIQGEASDIVVKAMNRLSVMSYRMKKPQYQAVLNIHDDLTFCVPDSSLEEDIEIIAKEMVRPFPMFYNVPLVVEGSVGKNWADLEEVGEFTSTQFKY